MLFEHLLLACCILIVFGRRVGGGKTNTILVCVEFSAHYCVCHLPDISKNKLHYD